mgnify:CR=1 FL=1
MSSNNRFSGLKSDNSSNNRFKSNQRFKRFNNHSRDNSNIIDAILEFLQKSKYKFENIILLQPTSPLRKTS